MCPSSFQRQVDTMSTFSTFFINTRRSVVGMQRKQLASQVRGVKWLLFSCWSVNRQQVFLLFAARSVPSSPPPNSLSRSDASVCRQLFTSHQLLSVSLQALLAGYLPYQNSYLCPGCLRGGKKKDTVDLCKEKKVYLSPFSVYYFRPDTFRKIVKLGKFYLNRQFQCLFCVAVSTSV